jgi:hypothetical protein
VKLARDERIVLCTNDKEKDILRRKRLGVKHSLFLSRVLRLSCRRRITVLFSSHANKCVGEGKRMNGKVSELTAPTTSGFFFEDVIKRWSKDNTQSAIYHEFAFFSVPYMPPCRHAAACAHGCRKLCAVKVPLTR